MVTAEIARIEVAHPVDAKTARAPGVGADDRNVYFMRRCPFKGPHLCGTAVTEKRALAAREDSSHLACMGRHHRMTDHVHALVHSMQPPMGEPMGDRAAAETSLKKLSPRYHAVLSRGD